MKKAQAQRRSLPLAVVLNASHLRAVAMKAHADIDRIFTPRVLEKSLQLASQGHFTHTFELRPLVHPQPFNVAEVGERVAHELRQKGFQAEVRQLRDDEAPHKGWRLVLWVSWA